MSLKSANGRKEGGGKMTSRFSVANMGILVIKIEKGRSKIFSDLPQLSDLGRGGGGVEG